MRINRSYAGGVVVALVAVAGLVVALAPRDSGGKGGSNVTTARIVPGAASANLGPLQLTNGYVPQPASPSVAAAYFTIKNTSSEPDTLLGVTSPVSTSVGLHEEVIKNGAGTMVGISSIPIPANGTMTLSTGQRHLMITNPVRPLLAGDSVEVTVQFARAGSMTLTLPVVSLAAAYGSADAGSMSGMDMR